MVFNSLEFLIFFPAVALLHFIIPQKYRWILLLAASYYFYLSWNVELVYLIVFTTAISYVCARIIEKTDKKGIKKLCIVATLVVSLGVLFFYKYFDFMSDSVVGIANLFGAEWSNFSLNLILPVGISFYTFQTLSYAIDVYRGNVAVEKHFGYYALYVSFFPQLVAGPIERPENLIPQLHADNRFNRDDFVAGMRMMLIGFFKKVVVADLCATYVVRVYDAPGDATGLSVVAATVLFAFQIYGDFAGYTDIAIGCARVMGIKLMQNFNRPYIAESIKEFWGRWHISLSSWFKDYLYIPLGGNRCSKARHMTNLMIVFLVSGLWHGAAWTYVIWGAIHGAYQVIGALTAKTRARIWAKLKVNTDSRLSHLWRRGFTFALVCFAWIFFRANNFSDLGVLLTKLFTGWSFSDGYLAETVSSLGINTVGALTAVISIFIMSRLDINGLRPDFGTTLPSPDGVPAPAGKRPFLGVSSLRYVYVVWAIAFAWLMLLVGDGASSFIYFQF